MDKLEQIKNDIDRYLSYDAMQDVVNHITKKLVSDLVNNK